METINRCVDLVPVLKRYRCTLVSLDSSIPSGDVVFAYAYSAEQARMNSEAYFKKTLGPFTQAKHMFDVTVVFEEGEPNEAVY